MLRSRMRLIRPLVLSQPAVLGALAVAFVFSVGTALLGVASTREVEANNVRIGRTHEVILAVQRLLTAMTDIETGQRGYLLTGDEKYLQPYRDANVRIDPLVESLRQQLADDPHKNLVVNQLATLIATRRSEVVQTIGLREKGAIGAMLNVVETDTGEQTMASLRRMLNQLQTEEMAQLRNLSARSAERIELFQKFGLGLVVVAVLLTAAAGVLIARRVRELTRALTVCAWTKRVKWKDNWISFEEFLEQRFSLRFTHGISEEAARQFTQEALEAHRADEKLAGRQK